MLEWRLKAYRHWLTMPTPDWAKLNIPPIDYQDAYYCRAQEEGWAEIAGRGRSRNPARL
jgi:Fe-S cluster assembly protein SufB